MPDEIKIVLGLVIVTVCLSICTLLVVRDMGRVKRRKDEEYQRQLQALHKAFFGQTPLGFVAHGATVYLSLRMLEKR
jgi:hypothetical protein